MKTASNIRRLNLLIVACAAGFWLAACSTPASRIKANPDVFARLSPAQQALVKAGQVGLGFDQEATKLALGDPDRVTVRTDADGRREIWHYAVYEADGHMLFSGYYHTGRHWWDGGWAYPYYLDYPHRQVRDRFRVEFNPAGKVAVITEEVR